MARNAGSSGGTISQQALCRGVPFTCKDGRLVLSRGGLVHRVLCLTCFSRPECAGRVRWRRPFSRLAVHFSRDPVCPNRVRRQLHLYIFSMAEASSRAMERCRWPLLFRIQPLAHSQDARLRFYSLEHLIVWARYDERKMGEQIYCTPNRLTNR